jgi:molybdate transport system ATP-binding protein
VSPAILELSGVVKDYHALRPLRIAELRVGAAERVALLGLDRIACEVFVNLVTGATLPESGHVRVFGRTTAEIGDSDDWLATVDRFGIVSERAVLLDQVTAIQNLAMPFTLEIEPPPSEVLRRATAIAQEVGLPPAAWDRPASALDAAGRARLRLGRALALDPEILLLEHVTAGLTAVEAEMLAADLRRIAAARRAALVAATLEDVFAASVADRVLKWQPATGQLLSQRTRRWFGRRLIGL